MGKPIKPLSDAEIRTTKPGAKTKNLFDGNGLLLEIKSSGARFWRFCFSLGGRRRKISIGPFPAVSLADARRIREEYRGLVAQGIDPMVARAKPASETFEAVALEWHAAFSPAWAPKHARGQMLKLKKDLFPALGKRQVSEISPPELLAVIQRLAKRGVLETAHRALVLAGQVFRYAVQTGRAKIDPARDLRGAIPPAQVKHHAAITDPEELGRFLRGAMAYPGLIVRCALRLSPLLAVRPGELRHMQWADVDFAACEWRFLASKTKQPHVVPLCRQAVEILRELEGATGDGKYAFSNPRAPDGSRPMSENAVLVALRSMGYSGDELTGHGFRATFRTLGAEQLGFRPDLMEHQLAHCVRDPLGRAYNRTQFLPERREMMQAWADWLDGLT